jgi:methylenetetrahydrofolate reductase (NADPH)
MKIIDIIKKNEEDNNKVFFSFEYFPPKTDKGVENLYDRLDRMSEFKPAWIDVTWGAGGSTSKLTLEICETAQKLVGLETMMHMTCTNLPKEELSASLKKAKEAGIMNILALRGDPPRGEEWKQVEGGFAHAADLVRFIRQEHGNHFGICVAGYPEGHIDCTSYQDDLKHLKEKVDAGADLIITQLFYDIDLFLKFVKDCRELGIKCPIIPGMMPIHGYAGFTRMTALCKTHVPQQIFDALEPIKNDDEAVKNYGVRLGIEMCQKLLNAGIRGLHFYTLNLEKSVVQILEGLKLVDPDVRRPLPWRAAPTRKEDVRPIFWSNRPKSYMQRTASWDEFPNGRWGDSRSPAYGELTDYHLASLHVTKEVQDRSWVIPLNNQQDLNNVFAKYCRGEVKSLPWCDSPLLPESELIKDNLIKVNQNGFLTINSQPASNGIPSTDERMGWGPKGGFVYQKAYTEFFVSPEHLKLLLEGAKRYPSLTYHAVNLKGESFSNTSSHSVNAVTWGVFPGKEIVQPTVVEYESFFVWKDEAFALWRSLWALLYDEGSVSRHVIDNVLNNWYLMNIVENNYVNGDIFAIFQNVTSQLMN